MTFDGRTTVPIKQAVRDALIAFVATMAQARPRQPSLLAALTLRAV
jgi:hypothetical protein